MYPYFRVVTGSLGEKGLNEENTGRFYELYEQNYGVNKEVWLFDYMISWQLRCSKWGDSLFRLSSMCSMSRWILKGQGVSMVSLCRGWFNPRTWKITKSSSWNSLMLWHREVEQWMIHKKGQTKTIKQSRTNDWIEFLVLLLPKSSSGEAVYVVLSLNLCLLTGKMPRLSTSTKNRRISFDRQD